MKIRMLPFLVALTLALTLTVAVRTASAQDSSFVPTATTIPCPMALPASQVEGENGDLRPNQCSGRLGQHRRETDHYHIRDSPQQVAVTVSRPGHLF